MKNIKYIIGICFVGLIFSSCIKEADYDVIKVSDKVEITDGYIYKEIVAGDTVVIKPTYKYSNPKDSADYIIQWYLNGEFISEGKEFEYTTTEPGSSTGGFITATNTKSNVTMKIGDFAITVSSPFSNSFYVIYEDNGQPKFGVVKPLGVGTLTFKVTPGVFESVNGEPLHTNTNKIQRSSAREMIIFAKDGIGSRTISNQNVKQSYLLRKEFGGEVFPAGFDPSALFQTTTGMYIINADGKIYARSLPNWLPNPHLVPYSKIPVYAEGLGDIDIKHGISVQSGGVTNFLYNKAGNFIVLASANYRSGGGTSFTKIPIHSGIQLPAEYTPLDAMGDMEVLFFGASSTFINPEFCLILKDPADNYYHQTFGYGFDFIIRDQVVKIGQHNKRVQLPLDANENSAFMQIPNRDYLLFTGGANNDKLYFIDLDLRETGANALIEFADFNGKKITSLSYAQWLSPQYLTVLLFCVGLDNGDFLIYSAEDAEFQKTTHQALFEGKLGEKIIDVAYSNNGAITQDF
ncbi:MAG: PKD-like family lipoprotein [Clostridia bacterium]|nr:PKD-like family lipoprotein [Clostridia bacterium]